MIFVVWPGKILVLCLFLYTGFFCLIFLFIHRFQVALHLTLFDSNRSQTKKVAHKPIAECATDILNTF